MDRITTLWKRQPVVVIALVEAALGLLIAFGVDLTLEQGGAILVFVNALGLALGWTQVSPAEENRWMTKTQG